MTLVNTYTIPTALHRTKAVKILMRELDLSSPEATGTLVMVLSFCLENTTDGRLDGIEAFDIADECRFMQGSDEDLLDALVYAGVLAFDENETLYLTNWDQLKGNG